MTGANGQAKKTSPEVIATQIDSSPSTPDPEATLDSSAVSSTSATERLSTEPKSIGPYQLIRKLGEGGMGQVWLAEQTAPIHRQVALKLIKVGMYDDDVLHRFQSERQSLAMMDHPAIAKVFDAGATPDGRPYFVMEYVPGVPITRYCDQKRLTIKQRLELFIKVCEGIQHAHQKAIIHRDLKPPNILVTEVDGKPVPRIIDFGLAKATTSELGSETMFTRVGAFVGTPGYMSPEQANTTVQDVDTRTDVYSLGVVLYVLLTGAQPLDTEQWHKQPLYEVLRKLREVEPPRPSSKIRMEKPSSPSRADLRAVEPKQLETLLHGDLDWITMKALEKDRSRRYDTPIELAADIGRYLRHEPVIACPPSAGYRLRKYIQRHRIAVGVAAGVAALFVGFVILQAIQLRQTRMERDRANRERDTATRITNFMTNMFKVSDPTEARGNTITAREVLDKASKDIDTGLQKDPELQAQMMYVMANTYDNLGLYSQAESLLRRAVEIRQRVLGAANPNTLDTECLLGAALQQLGRTADSEKLLQQAFTESQSVLGQLNPTTIQLENQLSLTLSQQGRDADAERLGREALDNSRRALGPESPQTLKTLFALSAILGDEGKYAESEKLNREALDLCRQIHGPDDPETLGGMKSLASTLSDEGHYGDAQKLDQEALEVSLRVNGPRHPSTAGFTYDLACLAALQGQSDRALSLLQESLDRGLRNRTALRMDSDSDLKSLHGNPQFEKIVAKAKQRATAQISQTAQTPQTSQTQKTNSASPNSVSQ
jgi:eukaryotic-like serine/threonine-protein kinase